MVKLITELAELIGFLDLCEQYKGRCRLIAFCYRS